MKHQFQNFIVPRRNFPDFFQLRSQGGIPLRITEIQKCVQQIKKFGCLKEERTETILQNGEIEIAVKRSEIFKEDMNPQPSVILAVWGFILVSGLLFPEAVALQNGGQGFRPEQSGQDFRLLPEMEIAIGEDRLKMDQLPGNELLTFFSFSQIVTPGRESPGDDTLLRRRKRKIPIWP